MKKLSDNFFLVSFFFFSIVLGVLSLPRLIAGIKTLYPNAVYEHILQDEKPANELIVKANIKLKEAIEWNQNSHYWLQLAHFFQALIYSDEFKKNEYLALNSAADKANQNCLLISAVEPYVWYRLAVNRFIVDEKDMTIENLLKFSVYTGRIEPNLLISRLSFLARYIDSFDDELISLVKDQIRLAWLSQRQQLINIIIDFPALQPFFYDALAPEEHLILNQHIAKIIQKNN